MSIGAAGPLLANGWGQVGLPIANVLSERHEMKPHRGSRLLG